MLGIYGAAILMLLLGLISDVAAMAADDPVDVIIVVGAPGTKEFGESFAGSADIWKSTCQRIDWKLHQIGPSAESDQLSDRDRLKTILAETAALKSNRPLWLVLIGHGTWDGATANFNLVGPDVSASELGGWIENMKRPLVIANCASSSGPFVNRLSGSNRVIVTATKSGSEQNYSRFGQYFASALSSLDADLDHDDSISVREAFLKASDETNRFYTEQGRLATEHALLEDNNDKKGSSSALIRGTAKTKGKGKVDGELANRVSIPADTNTIRLSETQIAKRDDLESKLRDLQSEFQADQTKLRAIALPVLLELAKLYSEAAKAEENPISTEAP